MNNEERDRRVMLALNHLGIPRSVEAYCDEWKRQFGTEAPPVPRFPDLLPVPPFPTGAPIPETRHRNLAIPMDYRDGQITDLYAQLWDANKKLQEFEGFWERAALAIGMEHPPRLIDPIPPERQYQRNGVNGGRFDDGWREFTEEDVLNYLRGVKNTRLAVVKKLRA